MYALISNVRVVYVSSLRMGKRSRRPNAVPVQVQDPVQDGEHANAAGGETGQLVRQKHPRSHKGARAALPFVSVCTPTFNRRPFIPYAIMCFLHQDYPRDKLEWIIVDDGSDPIEDLVKDVPGVKYFRFDGEKMPLGKKRNIMHQKAKGDIIVYQDDDDYYPRQRVSHAVETLMNSKHAVAAGASEIYIWFKHLQQMYQFGPYSPTHATAGTFAFKRQLIDESSYDDTACLAEERKFLKDYSVPFVQLDPRKTILVFSHEHNTFDKRKLLEGTPNPQFCKPSPRTVDEFVKEAELKEFFMNQVDEQLKFYEPGHPRMKPDVLKQIQEIDKQRAELEANNVKIQLQQPDGTFKELNNKDIVELLNKLQREKEEMHEAMRNYNPTITFEHGDGSKDAKSIEDVVNMLQNALQENGGLKAQMQKMHQQMLMMEQQVRQSVHGEDAPSPLALDAGSASASGSASGSGASMENMQHALPPQVTNIMMTDETGAQRYATTDEVVGLIESGHREVQRLQTELQMSQFQLISKNSEITFYEKKIEKLDALRNGDGDGDGDGSLGG